MHGYALPNARLNSKQCSTKQTDELQLSMGFEPVEGSNCHMTLQGTGHTHYMMKQKQLVKKPGFLLNVCF
jgi:hypothetical protein